MPKNPDFAFSAIGSTLKHHINNNLRLIACLLRFSRGPPVAAAERDLMHRLKS
jgi:hypothetical protein